MKTYKFKGTKIYIEKLSYPNGRTALEFTNAKTGESHLTATVNIPEQELLPEAICIKTWCGNEEVLAFLIAQGIISKTKYKFPVGAGLAIVHVVDLLMKDF